jgi:hypothetical protein
MGYYKPPKPRLWLSAGWWLCGDKARPFDGAPGKTARDAYYRWRAREFHKELFWERMEEAIKAL